MGYNKLLQKRYRIKLINLIMILSFIYFSIIVVAKPVSAIECGPVPTNNCEVTQNTAFNQETYYLPNGIRIMGDNIILNCNSSTLIGSGGLWGIRIGGDYDNNTIKNCNILNYTYGIYLLSPIGNAHVEFNTIVGNTIKNTTYGVYFLNAPNNTIKNNTIENNAYGIYLDVAIDYPTEFRNDYNNITQNVFKNNSNSDIDLGYPNSNFNNVWNNTIYNRILYRYTGENNYVVNGIGNIYIGNATGPTSEGLYIYNNLIVNSNRNYISQDYYLPNGINLLGDSITLNCNYSAIIGSGSSIGIEMGGNSNNTIKNCNIINYTKGISLVSSTGNVHAKFNTIMGNTIRNTTYGVYFLNAPNNTIKNNTIENNAYGIYLDVAIDYPTEFRNDYNNITQNIIQDNIASGIYIRFTNSLFNTIWKNNFIDTNSSYSGSNNNWNTSGQGNYWNNYDTEAEGCYDSDSNLICDEPYNISGSAGNKDYLPLLGLQILDIIPIQVIKDVYMVKGKTTLVRSIIKNSGASSKNINVSLYFEGNIKDSVLDTINSGEEKDIDLWFIPDIAGSNKEIEIKVEEN